MATPHDALFQQVFSDPRHAEGLLRALLPPEVGRLVAWETLRSLPTTFKDPAHGDRHADLLFEVEIGGRPTLLYLLLEHKSDDDPWTPLQLLVYVTRILEREHREHPESERHPPIIAIVVHHGARGWRRGTELLDLFDLTESTRGTLGPLLPQLRFVVDDLARVPARELLRRTLSALGRLTLLCMQQVRVGRDPVEVLRELRDAFAAARAAPDSGSALLSVVGYIVRVLKLPRDDLRLLVPDDPELEGMMTSAYDEMLAIGAADMLLQQLKQRFGPLPEETEERVRSADLAQIRRWVQRVLEKDSLEAVLDEE